jgi:uncharacterized protein involved in exopolysaccharide biosynthesis
MPEHVMATELDQGSSEEVSLAGAIDVVRRHRKLVVRLPAALLILTVLVTLLQRRPFESTTSFAPQSGDATRTRLAGLAAQFGINVPLADAGQSLGFYADLVKSREILGSVVRTQFLIPSEKDSLPADLMQIYDVAGKTDGERFEAALKRLRAALQVDDDPVAGLIKVSYRSRWPTLSQQVLQRILELVNDFNLKRRQSQAAAERVFVEARLVDSKAELRSAENDLQAFLQRNREYRNSATLTFEYDRLSREVALRQQIYTGLSQSFEQARIEEVRNTPVITTVERPNLPANPVSRRLVLKAFGALTIGGMLGISVAFGLDLIRRDLGRRQAI